jgi:hypothetical protein
MEPLEEPQQGALPTMSEIVDAALRAVAALKMSVSSVTSAVPDENGWSVSIELVERRGIPTTNDLLGLYEMRLDRAGNVVRYARTRIRRRCDFAG